MLDMRQPKQPLEGEEEDNNCCGEEEEDSNCYAACLTEDLQLFGQLNDLQAEDLLQLTNVVSVSARNEREKGRERFICTGEFACDYQIRVDLQEQAWLRLVRAV